MTPERLREIEVHANGGSMTTDRKIMVELIDALKAQSSLDFVSHDELIDELARRNDGLVVATTKKAVAEDAHVTTVDYRGGIIRALGLATHAANRIKIRCADAESCDEEGNTST